MPDPVTPVTQVLVDELRTRIEAATDDNLSDGGRYFSESCRDLTRCGHGDTGEYSNRADGKLIELLWNNRKTLLAALTATKPSDDVEFIAAMLDDADRVIEVLTAERAQIVAFVREWSGDTSYMDDLADAIERGDYLTNPSPSLNDDTQEETPEISEEYLDAMQRNVDAQKPEGFTLTPIVPAASDGSGALVSDDVEMLRDKALQLFIADNEGWGAKWDNLTPEVRLTYFERALSTKDAACPSDVEIKGALEVGLEHAIDAANEATDAPDGPVFGNCMRDVKRIETALATISTKDAARPSDAETGT